MILTSPRGACAIRVNYALHTGHNRNWHEDSSIPQLTGLSFDDHCVIYPCLTWTINQFTRRSFLPILHSSLILTSVAVVNGLLLRVASHLRNQCSGQQRNVHLISRGAINDQDRARFELVNCIWAFFFAIYHDHPFASLAQTWRRWGLQEHTAFPFCIISEIWNPRLIDPLEPCNRFSSFAVRAIWKSDPIFPFIRTFCTNKLAGLIHPCPAVPWRGTIIQKARFRSSAGGAVTATYSTSINDQTRAIYPIASDARRSVITKTPTFPTFIKQSATFEVEVCRVVHNIRIERNSGRLVDE